MHAAKRVTHVNVIEIAKNLSITSIRAAQKPENGCRLSKRNRKQHALTHPFGALKTDNQITQITHKRPSSPHFHQKNKFLL